MRARDWKELPIGTGLCAGLLLATVSCAWADEEGRQRLDGLLTEVSAERFRTHMTVLADDAMDGRETGTEGYLAAARYVAAQFAEFGLVPMGDGTGYFQQVPFLSTRLDPESPRFVVQRGVDELELVFPDDYVMSGSFGAPEEAISAALVFVGYGIHAPQHGHDDFRGIDVNGKILVRLTGAPPRFPADERAFYSSSWVKNGLAVERGAVGVITVRAPVDLPRLPWQRYVSAIGSSEMRWVEADGTPFEAFTELIGDAVVSEAGAAKLFAFAGRDLEALFAHHEGGETGSFEFNLTASLGRRSVTERLSAPNVVAKVPGRDPRLRGEYLLYTAHLDHLGVRLGDSGDGIHNGAYDNSAGIATMFEAARVMAGAPDSVRRSVLFAAFTGEEKGLQGSSYLAENPPVPIECMVAVINVDMPYLGFPIAEIMGLGVEHSTLEAALMGAAREAGLEFIPDPRPELVRFIRSDQFSFVRRGVPGLNLKPGAQSSDPAVDGPALHEQYLGTHYHRPSDDLQLPFSPEGAERFARVALLLGLNVATADQRPQWNAGDFFGQRFAKATTSTRCNLGHRFQYDMGRTVPEGAPVAIDHATPVVHGKTIAIQPSMSCSGKVSKQAPALREIPRLPGREMRGPLRVPGGKRPKPVCPTPSADASAIRDAARFHFLRSKRTGCSLPHRSSPATGL